MTDCEILRQFEYYYEAIHPAQENSSESYAWFSNVPHLFLNVVIRLSCDDVCKKVDALMQRNSLNLPMSFWVHPENRAKDLIAILKDRHFHSVMECPLMTWAVKPTRLIQADIRCADMSVFHEILSEVYQLDDFVKKSFAQLTQNIDCENYIYYVDGKPISVATLFVHGSAAEILNDATLPGRREVSEEMMRFLMHRAYQLGLKRLVLLSCPEAEELYNNLGFESVFNVEIYAR